MENTPNQDAAKTSKAQPPKSNSSLQPLTQSTESAKKIKDSKNNGLRKCFAALVDRKQVNLELEVVRLMLRKELNIKLNSLDPLLATTLPYLLVHYIKHWPGWQRSVEYYSGKITFKTWYDKFFKFITLKLNEAINVHFNEALEGLNLEESAERKKLYAQNKIIDRNTQTDNLAPKSMSPYTIEITAEPILLNTIVFTDTPDGDIIMKQHVLEWNKEISDNITVKQLITWPHVGVHFRSPVFSFTRKNLNEFQRYISLVGTHVPSKSVDFIDTVRDVTTHNTDNRMAYTLGYLKELSEEFLEALKNVYTNPEITAAFEIVINELLADVVEIDMQRNGHPTLPTATSVLFNIGKCTYFRNKKLSKGPPTRYDVGYTEVIIPKMETTLDLVASDTKIDEYIKHLTTFNRKSSQKTGQFGLPQITFSCTYCKEDFEDTSQMINHLINEHKLEQPMLCVRCKKPFPAFELTNVRWKHDCAAAP